MENLIKEIRKDLRDHKNQWVFKDYSYKGYLIRTKRFNTWFQVFKIDNINYPFPMELKQKDLLDLIKVRLKDL